MEIKIELTEEEVIPSVKKTIHFLADVLKAHHHQWVKKKEFFLGLAFILEVLDDVLDGYESIKEKNYKRGEDATTS